MFKEIWKNIKKLFQFEKKTEGAWGKRGGGGGVGLGYHVCTCTYITDCKNTSK